ncbi:MAG: Trk family potassium uptake protein [Thermoanaerobacteraceae bacterium]|nr:Trk family potassium uptake protein [Thermoanaerobacteraceae bacterium]
MGGLFDRLGPFQLLVLGFAGVIIFGALLLTLPVASENGISTNFLDALFTATSAVCVTGLAVVDTATHWSTFGELVIMLLIQIGGWGIMTFAAFFALLVGKKIGLKERLVLKEALNKINVSGVVKLVRQILITTLIIESAGALVLAVRFLKSMPLSQAVYYGIFHSISAFNNAGFDLFGSVTGQFSSLTAFVSDPVISLTIALLFITGGLGFSVIVALSRATSFKGLDLHTKMVVITTAGLLGFGFIAVLLLEWDNPATMGGLSWGKKMLAAFFQAATPRTAGFNTLDTAALTVPTQFLIIILMFIGASPGSTGGGVKTTTAASLFYYTRGILMGNEEPTAFERRIPLEAVRKAVAVALVSFTWIMLVTMALLISEGAGFLVTLFETVSAFGTVGLSVGLTGKLSLFGKILIIMTMFLGRLGPLTLVFAIAQRKQKTKYRYPEDQILIG